MESFHADYEWKNYRIKLHNLTDDQKDRILEGSYARRFLYNWALEICNNHYDKFGKIPNYQELSRMFTLFKKEPGNEWLDKINVTTCRYAFIDLANAFHKFIKGVCNHPIFKERKSDSIRIAIRSSDLSFKGNDGRYAFIPVISAKKGDLIDCGNHNIPFHKGVKYNNVRIKFDGRDYWLSLSVKIYKDNPTIKPIIELDKIIGVDVGVRTAATLSNGKTYDRVNPARLKVLEHRRRVLQSAVDRDLRRRTIEAERTRTKYEDIPKSKNQLKRESKLAKTRIQIKNLHQSHYHKISKEISESDYDVVVLETLNISRLVQTANGRGKHEIYESRMATLAEYIEYKCLNKGKNVIRAERTYPSSQICSRCGNIHKPGPSKIYMCPNCGYIVDRDFNASTNLKNYGISIIMAT